MKLEVIFGEVGEQAALLSVVRVCSATTLWKRIMRWDQEDVAFIRVDAVARRASPLWIEALACFTASDQIYVS